MKENKQTVLITGATSGLGLAFAKSFYRRGHNLVLVGRNPEKLEEVKNILAKSESQSISLITLDLSSLEAGQKLYDICKAQQLKIDILVNNAGRGLFGEHVDVPPLVVAKLLLLNIVTPTLLCNLFGKEMKERKSGYILNIASTAAYQPLPFFDAYASSKTYILHFSEALAKELEDYNVGVTVLSPGHVDTKFFADAGISDSDKGFFALKSRASADSVAEFGIEALFAKKLSVIPGFKDKLRVLSVRFAPRHVLSAMTKKMMKQGS